jgi:hypothetical protein
MDIVRGAGRLVARGANATTAAAGAVGGAAVNGAIGGVQGAMSGIRDGLANGSHSTPAAALTLGVIGAAGLVEWPVLLAVGGTALAVHEISRRSGAQVVEPANTPQRSASAGSGSPRKSAPRKSTARKSATRKAPARRRSTSRNTA